MAVLFSLWRSRRDRKDFKRATAPACGVTVPRVLPERSWRAGMSTRSLDLGTREGRQERRARFLRLEAQRQVGPAPSPPVARHRRGRLEAQSPAVRLRKSRRHQEDVPASEEPRVDIITKLRAVGVDCPRAQPLPVSRWWLHSLFVARRLGLQDLGSRRHDGTRALDGHMQRLREGTTETTAEIAGTNVYVERQNEWSRARLPLFFWFVHPEGVSTSVPLPTPPSCSAQKRVVKALLDPNVRDLFIALVEGDVDEALTIGSDQLCDWSERDAFKLVLNTQGLQFRSAERGPPTSFANQEAMRAYTARVCKSVAEMEELILWPTHRERYGCGYGGLPAPVALSKVAHCAPEPEPEPGMLAARSTAHLFKLLTAGFDAFRGYVAAEAKARTPAYRVGDIDIVGVWLHLQNATHPTGILALLLDSVAGYVTGDDLVRRWKAVLVDDGAVSLPLTRADVINEPEIPARLFALEALLVLRADMGCVVRGAEHISRGRVMERPPLMRTLSIVSDTAHMPEILVGIRHLLQQSSSYAAVARLRDKIDAQHVNVVKLRVKEFLKSYRGVCLMYTLDNQDEKGKSNRQNSADNSEHVAASQFMVRPSDQTRVWPGFVNLHVSRKQMAEHEIRHAVENWRQAEPKIQEAAELYEMEAVQIIGGLCNDRAVLAYHMALEDPRATVTGDMASDICMPPYYAMDVALVKYAGVPERTEQIFLPLEDLAMSTGENVVKILHRRMDEAGIGTWGAKVMFVNADDGIAGKANHELQRERAKFRSTGVVGRFMKHLGLTWGKIIHFHFPTLVTILQYVADSI